MPKKIGAAYRRQLRAASNLWERYLLCTYGRLYRTDAAFLAALVTDCDDIEKRVRQYDQEGGGRKAWKRITADCARPSLEGENIARFRNYAKETRKRMEQEVAEKVSRAIWEGNSTVFEQLAEIVEAKRVNGGKSFDPLGAALMFLLADNLGRMYELIMQTRATARLPMTEIEVVEFLLACFPDLRERGDFPREVRRKCDELGIILAKAKRGRPKGSSNRQGQK
jgi:hypothetical protein